MAASDIFWRRKEPWHLKAMVLIQFPKVFYLSTKLFKIIINYLRLLLLSTKLFKIIMIKHQTI